MLLKSKREPVLDDHSSEIPSSLTNFKLHDLYSGYHANISNNEFKRYFCVSSDNIDNLTMMKCRPSS